MSRPLLVASTGGHLAQLFALAPRLSGIDLNRALWVTFDTPQSRSLLEDKEVRFLPYIGPREVVPTTENAARLARMLGRERVDTVVSTGAAIALSAMVPAIARGIPCHYIESSARSEGPSLTGRLLSQLPGIRLYSQYRAWAGGRWGYRGSIFDGFVEGPMGPLPSRPRVVVSLGTIKYQFTSLLMRLDELIPADWEILWQIGETTWRPSRGEVVDFMPAAAFATELRAADIVVTHAGIGSALGALDAGRVPVLVPRAQSRGEHVDDHQRQIAAELHGRGLAVHAEPGGLQLETLLSAGRRSVTTVETARPFALQR